MTSSQQSAQIALGKFYLHRWEGQVLVDWATSMLDQDHDAEPFKVLADMEGKSRAVQLDQFLYACQTSGIVVYENVELAITAYVEDLKRRTLAGEIEASAAFAQLRPLAYDNTAVIIPGLNELDEDLNLLDSNQAPFHLEGITLENKEEFLMHFFQRLSVEEGYWNPEEVSNEEDLFNRPNLDYDKEQVRYVESVAIIILTLLFVFYVLLLLASVPS